VQCARGMPTLNLSTNVPLDAVAAADILKDCSRVLARVTGKPESVRDALHPSRSTQCLLRLRALSSSA
jgi:hypothetical protein